MQKLVRLAFLAALAALAVGVQAAAPEDGSASDAPTLERPKPSWYTPQLHAEIVAAGPRGKDVPLAAVEPNCLGYSPPYVGADGVSLNAVSAGGCMLAPSGCTMNFVFTNGTKSYIGTAGHCAGRGQTVVMQVATRVDPTGTTDPVATLAAVGKVVKSVNAGIGRDFALIEISAGFKVVPGIAGGIGPTGIFCGDPLGQPVTHYGHGYIFAVGPGVQKFGEVIPDLSLVFKGSWATGYNWAGYGLPGDSGSDVMNDAGLAVGNLTHGIGVLGLPVPGLSMGMTMQGIMSYIGAGYSLVTVDGRSVNCDGALLGLIDA